jgi:hypothetical protein
MGVITITFMYEYADGPTPSYAYNTRNLGRIAWKTVMQPKQTFDSVLQQLYKRSRCTANWRFMWHALMELDRNSTPWHGQVYGDEDEDFIIYCLEPL